MTDSPDAAYVAGLLEASGTFTGTFSPDELTGLLDPEPRLVPIEIDTGDRPNPAALPMTTFVIKINGTGDRYELAVSHTELLGSNRVRVWVRWPGQEPS